MIVASRRTILAGGLYAGAASATAALADAQTGIADRTAPALEFALELLVDTSPAVVLGRTQMGGRRQIPITGGMFSGPRIRGKVLPGGIDWQFERTDDGVILEATYTIQEADGTLIHVHNKGMRLNATATAPRYARTSPEFEVAAGPHDWLNRSIFIGTVDPFPAGGGVKIGVWRVL